MASIELAHPTGLIQCALQRSLDLVSFGLQAADTLEAESLRMPGTQHHVIPAPNVALDVATARTEYRSWVISNGLRDCVEAVGPSLEWARKLCFIWTRPGAITAHDTGATNLSATLTGDDWNRHIVREGEKFDWRSLREKLEYLGKSYGFVRPELSDAIFTINAARNCLSHRGGIVGQKDLKSRSDSGLVVEWRRYELVSGTGDSARVLEVPATVEAGETISVRIVETGKEIPLGERITFAASEFLEIVMTFLFFAVQISDSIRKLQEERRSEAQEEG